MPNSQLYVDGSIRYSPLSAGDQEDGVTSVATLIDAPVGVGAGRSGCQMGPEALRVAGLEATLGELEVTVRRVDGLRPAETGLDDAPGLRNLAEVAGWARVLAAETQAALGRGETPALLGGDHSLSMGSVAGAAAHWARQGRPFFVLWLDAHGDFNTPDTSPSGNMHGMPMALVCGEPGFEPVFGGPPPGLVDPARVHMLGLRSIDRDERRVLRDRGVHLGDMRQIDEFGVVKPLRQMLEQVEDANGVLHVSLDLDFLDPGVAPGVGTPVPGGVTYREAHLVMEMLHDSGRVGSVDLVELNPFLDERGRSAGVMVDLAASLFGRRVLETL